MLYLFARVIQTVPPILQQGVEEVKRNPTLKWTLLGIGAFCALVFLFGIIKHAVKAAILFAILSVGAWVWFFNVHG